jgi:Protein of unknown function (DUF1559).
MSANPYESPETVGYSPSPQKSRLPNLAQLLVVVGVVVVLIALLLPAIRMPGDSVRRMQCNNHLRQIALALHEYESVYHCLPPAYTVDAAGRPLHSWRTLILPFAEGKSLYERIDLSKPWDDPANQAALEDSPEVYRCPSAQLAKSKTTYLAVIANGGCFQSTKPRALAEITDDPNLTLMVIEVAAQNAVHWMSPQDATEEHVLNLFTAGKPPHPGGAQSACVSGNVLLLPRDSQPTTLRALISIAGHDDEVAKAAR